MTHYNMSDFAKVEKVDAHVHINSMQPDFVQVAREDNFRLLTINVDYPDFPPIQEQAHIAVFNKNANPEVVAYASTFQMKGWDDAAWVASTIAHLDSSFAQGAVAVKVWKNIGMDFHDKDGNNIMIDHPKFDQIFEHIHSQNKVLIGHQGEPKNCWLPIEEMTVNNDKEYFTHHPQYHMYLHPELPSYEDQMAARDRMLLKNPHLKFMGAHLASLEWSVDELAKFLDRFPEAVVDLAARMGQVQHQSSLDREKVRQFFIKYQDRVLYATDLTFQPGENDDGVDSRKQAHEKWWQDWAYLATDSTLQVPELDNSFQGLRLPTNVVNKIYRFNAMKTFPSAWEE